MDRGYRILIGGLGDDAHSVGLGLLVIGLRESGYFVESLGIRNSIHDFFKLASAFDIILISNKNGHAELYLGDFPRLLSEFRLTDDQPRLWYLGGSLSVSESYDSTKRKFLQMGFTDVYPQPIAFNIVLKQLERDIHRFNIKKQTIDRRRRSFMPRTIPDYDRVSDQKLSAEDVLQARQQILEEWPTGKEAGDISDTVDKQSSLDALLWKCKLNGSKPLLQPRTGVADCDKQLELLKYLESHGSQVSSVQLDAASRSKQYAKAEEGVVLSKERKQSVLNGFPIPVHGVEKTRNLVGSLHNSFQLRGGGPDHRFTYEIALSAGVSALEGGPICYLMPYDNKTPPEDSLRNWQYIDRICSMYYERYGVRINREYFGVLTAALIEPSIAIVVNIIQALLSAQQGIVSITVGYAEQGNRSQDIAALQTLETLVKYYLKKFNFRNVRLTTVFHQYMAAFPSDHAKAEELIFESAITSYFAKASKMMVKTAVEAYKIPSMYDNANALAICSKGFSCAPDREVNNTEIIEESRIITMEVTQMMDAILELGNGSVSKGALRAIRGGEIDIPWSPHVDNRNKVVTLRDSNGAIRFHSFGDLPLNSSLKEFHYEKIGLRQKLERDTSVFSLLEKDLSRIWKNDYQCWPLDGLYVN